MKIKNLAIFIFFIFFGTKLFAEIIEVNNNKIKILMENGTPLIDIRTEKEWLTTGVINQSKLLTFFDKDGNYDANKWLLELKKIASKNDPVIIICRSGRRSRIVSNFLDKQANYLKIFHATNGILSWIDSKNQTVKPD